MKKSSTDIAGLIIKMQEQLTFLEKKIDTLIAQPSARPSFEPRQHSKPYQRFDRSHHQGEGRESNDYRERVLHKAICADCKKECEVPFRPTGDRPVYCKECFSKRKAGSAFKGDSDNRSRVREFTHERPSHRHERGESRRPSEKKRPVFKKRKKHS